MPWILVLAILTGPEHRVVNTQNIFLPSQDVCERAAESWRHQGSYGDSPWLIATCIGPRQ